MLTGTVVVNILTGSHGRLAVGANELTPEQEELAQAITRALTDGRAIFRQAVVEARKAGVSANEIARRAGVAGVPGYSRPVVLRIVREEEAGAIPPVLEEGQS